MTSSKQSETVSAASKTGDRLRALIALRDTLARSIDNCDSLRDLGTLTARMTEVLQQIDSLTPTAKAGDPVDEVAQRRAARRSGAAKSQARAKANPE